MIHKLAILAFVLASTPVFAQLADGSTAPDFIAQDINGQSWHLYDLLEDDKIVILEISATWCPPCWAYHNSQALQNFYALHGPNGDNKARILSVEGDPNTNINCLYGQANCNYFSEGNFVEGTPYPIFDNAAIADLYEISYYPTIFIICPNKKLFEVGQLNAGGLWEKAQDCPVAFGQNNAGIYEYYQGSLLHEICDTLSLTPRFELTNLGSYPLTQATIELQWNNDVVQTLQWTGNLPLYGSNTINFDTLYLQEPGNLRTVIENINNGSGDSDYSNNVHNADFILGQSFENQQILLKIKTDAYGAETYWELHDEAGNVLDHGGNENVGPNGGGMFAGGIAGGPGAYGNGAFIKDTLTLPAAGCYSIHFVDAFGDGMCCNYGVGYYRMYNLNAPTMQIISGGQFGAYEHRGFGSNAEISGISDELVEKESVEIYPNPASTEMHCSIRLSDEAQIALQLYNTLGQLVRDIPETFYPSGETDLTIPVENLCAGLYFVQITINGRLLSRSFEVQH